MRRSILILLLALLSLSVITCRAQKQEYVGQYDAYFGFAYLTTPNMNLDQRGWQGQFGYNWRRWVAVGFDTSYFGGNSSITVPQLNNATIAKLAPILPLLPPGYTAWVALSREHLHHHGRSAVQLSRVQVGHAVYPSGPGRDVSKH